MCNITVSVMPISGSIHGTGGTLAPLIVIGALPCVSCALCLALYATYKACRSGKKQRGQAQPSPHVFWSSTLYTKALLFYVVRNEMCRGSHCRRRPFSILVRRRMVAAPGKRQYGTFITSRIQRRPSHSLVQSAPRANRGLRWRDNRCGNRGADAQGDLSIHPVLHDPTWSRTGAAAMDAALHVA